MFLFYRDKPECFQEDKVMNVVLNVFVLSRQTWMFSDLGFSDKKCIFSLKGR